jgi:hypothetical protein
MKSHSAQGTSNQDQLPTNLKCTCSLQCNRHPEVYEFNSNHIKVLPSLPRYSPGQRVVQLESTPFVDAGELISLSIHLPNLCAMVYHLCHEGHLVRPSVPSARSVVVQQTCSPPKPVQLTPHQVSELAGSGDHCLRSCPRGIVTTVDRFSSFKAPLGHHDGLEPFCLLREFSLKGSRDLLVDLLIDNCAMLNENSYDLQ